MTSLAAKMTGGGVHDKLKDSITRKRALETAMGRSFENRKASIFKTASQKSKLYAKYGKQLYVIAKNGVPDPESNPALRNLIEKAKRDQVPAHVIEKAIEKAKGGGGEDFSTARYEGFGPGGCSVIVDCLTDNPNRTISEVRTCFTKTGSKLGTGGSVSHFFDHMAVLSFAGKNEEQVLEVLLEAGVEIDETESNDGMITILCRQPNFTKPSRPCSKRFPAPNLTCRRSPSFRNRAQRSTPTTCRCSKSSFRC